MAQSHSKPIRHSTHPKHPLLNIFDSREFVCDGCETSGIGNRYRCVHDSCNFDLHEHCATCPNTLSSFMHPKHKLKLVTHEEGRVCDVCGDHIGGMFYKCKPCNFDVHPLCTKLPQYVRHALHHRTDHPPLELMPPPSSPTCCSVCGGACSSWLYRCVKCCVDIHLPCVLAPPCSHHHQPSSSSSSRRFYRQEGDQLLSTSSRRLTPPPNQLSLMTPGHFPAYGPYDSVPTGYPPCYGTAYAGPSAPPIYQMSPPPPLAYGLAPTFGASPYYYMNHQYQQPAAAHEGGGGGGTNGWKPNKTMFALLGHLALGVLTNVVFGVDVSAFI